jgi:hypothetical protein
MLAISSSVPFWLEKLVAGYTDDANAKQLWSELSISGAVAEGFTLQHGVIRRNGKFGWVATHWPNSISCKHCTTVALVAILAFWPHTKVSTNYLPGLISNR